MMATFGELNWQGITALIALLSATGTSIAWTFHRAYKLGMNSQQIKSIHESIELDIKPALIKLDKRIDRLEDRMDKRFDELTKLLLKKQ